MFRRPCLVAESAREVIPAADLVPLSLLELDLAAPVEGWNLHLADRNIEIVEDDIGRAAVSHPDVRQLLTEHRESEACKASQREEAERQAIERDRQSRAQLHGGIPATAIPERVHPALAMLQAAHDPRRAGCDCHGRPAGRPHPGREVPRQAVGPGLGSGRQRHPARRLLFPF
jgi:hypothetical protein